MTQCMTKVKQCTHTMFLRVFLNNCPLNLTAALDHISQCFIFPFCYCLFIVFHPFKICFIANQSMLDHFSQAAVVLSLRKCFYRVYINIYQLWHIKCTNHIFIGMIIYTSFPSNTAVYLC